MTSSWRVDLEKWLMRTAPGVVTTPMLERMTGNNGVSERALSRWLQEAVEIGKLVRVRRGLYLNRIGMEKPVLAEAAQRIRPGCVVSLETVLGEFGVLNNPPANAVSAILPLAQGFAPPSTRDVVTDAGVFRFTALSARILNAGVLGDRLILARTYPCATPEKALVDWLYLASTGRSARAMPPLECDIDGLDPDRLARLSAAAGVEATLKLWLDAKAAHDQAPDVEDGMSQSLGF